MLSDNLFNYVMILCFNALMTCMQQNNGVDVVVVEQATTLTV